MKKIQPHALEHPNGLTFRTTTDAAGTAAGLPPSVQMITVANTGWKRANSEPATSAKFRETNGRYTKDGGDTLSNANGGWWELDFLLNGDIRPVDFGAKADGSDDVAALNLLFAVIREQITLQSTGAAGGRFVSLEIDLGGGVYTVTDTVNATLIYSANWSVKNGVIWGKCSGKPVLDMVGTRGFHLSDLMVYGDITNRPTVGIQICRASDTPASYYFYLGDSKMTNVCTQGYFSTAAAIISAVEDSHFDTLKIWNYDNTGYVGVVEGGTFVPVTSAFATVYTPATSFIQCVWTACQFRHVPIEVNAGTVTAASNAAEGVLTIAGHGFSNGDTVVLHSFTGGTWATLNSTQAVVKSATTNTITLTGVNTSGLGSWATGAVARKQTKPTLYLARFEQHRFNGCYAVHYGDDAIQIDFPDATRPLFTNCTFDFLIEGAQVRSCYRFTVNGSLTSLTNCDFLAYNSFARGSYFSTDSGAGANVAFYNSKVLVANHTVFNTLPFADTPGEFYFYSGSGIHYPRETELDVHNFGAFYARVSGAQTGVAREYGLTFGSYTIAQLPTPSSSIAGMVVSCSNLGGGAGLVTCDGATWQRVDEDHGLAVVSTDAIFTLAVLTDAPNITHTGTLTANRVVTLSTTGVYTGAKFKIVRSANGVGFYLDIGGLRRLYQGTWCEVIYDGSAWVLLAYGKTAMDGGNATVSSDADFGMTVDASVTNLRHTGTLTADRTITISTTGAVAGSKFNITRTGGGAFNLSVGGLKNLATNTWCTVIYDGFAWSLFAYGAL